MTLDDDANFVPCRDDKCKVVGVHRAHPTPPETRRKVLDACPACGEALIRLPQTRGRCVRCAWRGSIKLQRTESQRGGKKDA